MPPAKTFVVGWRAFTPPTPTEPAQVLAVGRTSFQASHAEVALRMAVSKLPEMIHLKGCSIGIRYVKEKK